MNILLDKLALFVCCVSLLPLQEDWMTPVCAVLCAVTLSAMGSYWERRLYLWAGFLLYVGASLFFPVFAVFLPLLFYDVALEKPRWLLLFLVVPLFLLMRAQHFSALFSMLLFLSVAFLLRMRTTSLLRTQAEYRTLRDSTKEFSLRLENKNKDLMEKQDYEIRLATLNERNRIAREIHDNVGHLLSSSILQVGALQAVNQDPRLAGGLSTLRDTLSHAMDSIRQSVHNLHEESIDLYPQLDGLVKQFSFCPIKLDYEVEGSMRQEVKYCFITIVKEALSNIIRHSNATRVTITVREHPALYQLIIQDNGSQSTPPASGGLGLRSIADRVEALRGNLNIDRKNGFQLFISVPKEG